MIVNPPTIRIRPPNLEVFWLVSNNLILKLAIAIVVVISLSDSALSRSLTVAADLARVFDGNAGAFGQNLNGFWKSYVLNLHYKPKDIHVLLTKTTLRVASQSLLLFVVSDRWVLIFVFVVFRKKAVCFFAVDEYHAVFLSNVPDMIRRTDPLNQFAVHSSGPSGCSVLSISASRNEMLVTCINNLANCSRITLCSGDSESPAAVMKGEIVCGGPWHPDTRLPQLEHLLKFCMSKLRCIERLPLVAAGAFRVLECYPTAK